MICANIFRDNGSMFFYSTVVLLQVEGLILSYQIAKFRYIPNGKFIINNDELCWEKKVHLWSEITHISFYYRGDKFWKSRFFLRSYFRYHRLFWHLAEGMNEKMLDKIVINKTETIYFKIRNETEKEFFFKIKEIAISKGVIVNNIDTDFNYLSYLRLGSLYRTERNYYEEIGKIFPRRSSKDRG